MFEYFNPKYHWHERIALARPDKGDINWQRQGRMIEVEVDIISLNDDLVNPRKVVTARLTESGQWVSETNTVIYFRLRRFFNTRPLSSMHYYYCCPGLGRIFSPCHGGGILCLSGITSVDTKVYTGGSVLRQDVGIPGGFGKKSQTQG